MPFFSIIVPVYNVESFLEECLNSILAQRFNDYELIVVDDGSTDRSRKICDEYAKKDSKITVIHKQNGGLVSARKSGLRIAKGEYILNVDSDDYLSNDLLNILEATINNNHEPDIITFDRQNIDEKGKKTTVYREPIEEGYYNDKFLSELNKNPHDNGVSRNKYCISGFLTNKALKNNIARDNQLEVPDNISLGEDTAVIIPALYKSKSLYVKRYIGYYYRERSNSIVHTFSKDTTKRFEILINYLKREPNISQETITSYSFATFCLQAKNAALSTKTPVSFAFCLKDIYSDWLILFKDLPVTHLKHSCKMVYYLIILKQWYLLWALYKTIHIAKKLVKR